jgi:hypothetical protein
MVGQEDYIGRLYRSILGRSAAAPEVTNWLGVLRGPGGSDAVVNGIERSPEARTHLVDGWYQSYLGRSAVNGEEQTWVAALVGGASEEVVLAGILGSDEFSRRAQKMTSSGTPEQSYVHALYSFLLQRPGSAVEVADWIPALTDAHRAAVAEAFLHSTEYRADVIQMYYATLLHRGKAPTATEVNSWAETAANLAAIRAGFLESAEFTLNGQRSAI